MYWLRNNSSWLLFVGLTVLPLGASMIYALMYSFGVVGALSEGFTTVHWVRFLADGRFFRSLLFSFGIALVSIGAATATALWWTIRYRHAFRKGVLSYALYLPLVFPAMVAGFVAFQLWANGGLFARMAWQLGIIEKAADFPSLVQNPFGLGIALTHYLMAVPFLSLLFLNLWPQSRMDELLQTAESLGASYRQRMWRLAIPVLLRKGRPTLLLYGIFVAGSFEIPLLLGAQEPQMVAMYTWTKISRFDLNDRPQAYIAALTFTLVVLGLLIWNHRLGKRAFKPSRA